ncbi:hypothetical protein [Flagellimonas iocasae]|uniref:Uncharacterized protein n=1 Tax=Flagellimonas iocasae TaxID=2055905 RepID=A0ABW4XXH2_9FLAO
MKTLFFNKIDHRLFFFICLFCVSTTIAQIYPVQVTPQIIPPYSFKLSDYTTTSQEKLFVNLLLTDAQKNLVDRYG